MRCRSPRRKELPKRRTAEHLIGVATKRGSDNTIAHGDHQNQHTRESLTKGAHENSPEGGHVRPETGDVEVDVIKVPCPHLYHAKADERRDAILQRDDLLPMHDVKRGPEECNRKGSECCVAVEVQVGNHHAWEVSCSAKEGRRQNQKAMGLLMERVWSAGGAGSDSSQGGAAVHQQRTMWILPSRESLHLHVFKLWIAGDEPPWGTGSSAQAALTNR